MTKTMSQTAEKRDVRAIVAQLRDYHWKTDGIPTSGLRLGNAHVQPATERDEATVSVFRAFLEHASRDGIADVLSGAYSRAQEDVYTLTVTDASNPLPTERSAKLTIVVQQASEQIPARYHATVTLSDNPDYQRKAAAQNDTRLLRGLERVLVGK